MRKFFKPFFVIAAAAFALVSCVKENDAPVSGTKTVQFHASSVETKTAFGEPDGITYPTLWTANDTEIKVSLNLNSPKSVDVYPSDDYTTADFSATLEDDGSGSYVFYSMSPASAFNSFHSTNRYLSANIPTSQTPLETSVDESAQVLYAISDEYSEMPENVSLIYKHFTAYGKLSFVNLNLDGAKVLSVAVSSEENLAGRWNYLVDDDAFVVNSGASTVTINTSSTEDIWFACAPVDLSNKTLTITVNTDKGPLTKDIKMASGRKFEAGRIAKFTVDMKDAEFAESKTYHLVNSTDELTTGSEIIIVANNANVALSTTQNGNNRGQAAVTKSSDGSSISDPGTDVQILTIETGTTEGTVAFNTGTGYLYAASSSKNYLRTETSLSANSSWSVSFEEGIATIKAQGSNTRNWLRYNSSSSIFACYGSGQQDVSIYKLEGSGDAGSGPIEPEEPETPTEPEEPENLEEVTIEYFKNSAQSGDGIWYQLTGTITDIQKETFGNFVISDGEESVLIYGMTNGWVGTNDQSFAQIGLKVGDIVTLGTLRGEYGGVAQGGGNEIPAYYISHIPGETPTESYVFKKVSAITSGKSYLVVVASEGKVAKPETSKAYGYLNVETSTISNDEITLNSLTNAFVITNKDSGYTIKQSDGRYLYQTGNYNSFNYSVEPAEGDIWSFELQSDGSFKITNKLVEKYIQYSSHYSSYGSYADAQGEMPHLYELVD